MTAWLLIIIFNGRHLYLGEYKTELECNTLAAKAYEHKLVDPTKGQYIYCEGKK